MFALNWVGILSGAVSVMTKYIALLPSIPVFVFKSAVLISVILNVSFNCYLPLPEILTQGCRDSWKWQDRIQKHLDLLEMTHLQLLAITLKLKGTMMSSTIRVTVEVFALCQAKILKRKFYTLIGELNIEFV